MAVDNHAKNAVYTGIAITARSSGNFLYVYVSFAATNGGARGYVDVFSENGTLVKRLTHGKPLNRPWGFAMAPKNFGPLSNTLLVGNPNTLASTISGFNPTTGALVGTITNSKAKPIKIDNCGASSLAAVPPPTARPTHSISPQDPKVAATVFL